MNGSVAAKDQNGVRIIPRVEFVTFEQIDAGQAEGFKMFVVSSGTNQRGNTHARIVNEPSTNVILSEILEFRL